MVLVGLDGSFVQFTILIKLDMGLSKLQGKGVTPSQEVEWWTTSIAECVTLSESLVSIGLQINEPSRF